MDGFEINKIIASIILTIVVILGINKLADIVYNVSAPESSSYKVVTATETKESDSVKTGSNIDIKAFFALGSVDHGKTVFKT